MAPPRRTTLDLDLETVRSLVRGLDPALTVTGFGRLEGGSTELYRIDFAGSDRVSLVVKIYPDTPRWAPSKEKLVAGWLNGLDPPVPTWLRLDETRSVLPLAYAILTLLPGRPLRAWMDAQDIDAAYRQMGALLRRVHHFRMPAYGYVLGQGIDNPVPTNTDYMTAAFDDVFRRFRDLRGDAILGRDLERQAAASFGLLAEAGGAVLCHDDFHQGNVLARRDDAGSLRLSGLIDFDNARAADPLFDLAKALFCSAHEDPRSRQPILEGYGPVDTRDTARTLWLYTLFHRLSMWCWLTGLTAGQSAADGTEALVRDLQEMARERRHAV
jgi:Ser/Thr protein kinase RdoA (MazF antagonist)